MFFNRKLVLSVATILMTALHMPAFAYPPSHTPGENYYRKAESHYQRGRIADKERKYTEAIGEFNKANSLAPYNYKFNISESAAYLSRANANQSNPQKKKNDYEKALELADRAWKRKPKDGYSYFLAAAATLNLGQIDKSIKLFSGVLDISQDKSIKGQAYNIRGSLWSYKGWYQAALSDYKNAAALDPKYNKNMETARWEANNKISSSEKYTITDQFKNTYSYSANEYGQAIKKLNEINRDINNKAQMEWEQIKKENNVELADDVIDRVYTEFPPPGPPKPPLGLTNRQKIEKLKKKLIKNPSDDVDEDHNEGIWYKIGKLGGWVPEKYR
jgi:tetratricopeptide (TPR) repeat protein